MSDHRPQAVYGDADASTGAEPSPASSAIGRGGANGRTRADENGGTGDAGAAAAARVPRPLTRVRVLPHPTLCPDGMNFDVPKGRVLIEAMLANGIAVEHACEKVGACATCHVHLRSGGEAVPPADEDEEDQLDEAWAPDAQSRLACQVRVAGSELVVELPAFTRNHARGH